MSFVLSRRRMLAACVAGWTCALGGALAQAPVVVEPPAILLPNYC